MLGKQIWSLSLLVIIGGIKAEGDTDCIDVKPVENFNASASSGYWFTNRKTDEDGDTKNRSCLLAYFEDSKEENKLIGIRLWVDKSDNSKHCLGNDKGRWDQDGRGITLNGYPGTIIGVDYSSWMIVVTCDESINKRVVWARTRQQTLDSAGVNAVNTVMSKYGMDFSELSPVDQSGCPKNWDDAEKAK